MKASRLVIGVVAGIFSAQTAAPQSLDDPRMPPGPNRELAIRTCIGCHPLNFFYSTVGRTREGWSRTLDDMTRYGMNVTAEERALVLEYLATSLGSLASWPFLQSRSSSVRRLHGWSCVDTILFNLPVAPFASAFEQLSPSVHISLPPG